MCECVVLCVPMYYVCCIMCADLLCVLYYVCCIMCADVPPSGRYIYMDAAGRRQGDTAVISLAKVPGLRGPGCALSFWYNMYLDSAGTLEVTLRGTSTLIWTATGFLGNFWQQIFVPINDQTDFGVSSLAAFQYIIHMIVFKIIF